MGETQEKQFFPLCFAYLIVPLTLRVLGRLHLGNEKKKVFFFCISLGLHYLCNKEITTIMSMINLELLAIDVCAVARRVAEYIRNERRNFNQNCVEHKQAHDYVSYVDKQSEEKIVAQLRQLLPDAGFITEEKSATYQGEDYCWVVDPLDGTTNFIHAYPPYAVSIALISGKEILLGVVCDVPTASCYYAWKGGGAWLNGNRIHVSDRQLDDALLCLQLPYNNEAYNPVAKHLIDTFYGRVASIRMIGSAAIALCLVAQGCLDGYMEKYIGQWDYMAGAIIVNEAGGRVSNYAGSTDFTEGNDVVATNRLVHDDMLKAVAGV